MKKYYKCLKYIDGKTIVDYWQTSTLNMIINAYDFIIPLGNRKPRNIDDKEIKR